MGRRVGYEPGTFCWTDLATTDPEGAKTFYGDLFGWEADDAPAGERAYTILRLGGDDVCALYELETERRVLGVPSHWLSYVSVESADATARRAENLGGATFGGAFDVGPMGRWPSSRTRPGRSSRRGRPESASRPNWSTTRAP